MIFYISREKIITLKENYPFEPKNIKKVSMETKYALYDYYETWNILINGYVRYNENGVFNSWDKLTYMEYESKTEFLESETDSEEPVLVLKPINYKEFGISKDKIIKEIISKIKIIDDLFEIAPKTTKRQTVYRIVSGFNTGFFGLNKSYLSTSYVLDSVFSFSEMDEESLYIMILDEGIPYISMDKFSKFNKMDSENEILLLRNLYVSLIHEYNDDSEYEQLTYSERIKVFVVKVSLTDVPVNIDDYLTEYNLIKKVR